MNYEINCFKHSQYRYHLVPWTMNIAPCLLVNDIFRDSLLQDFVHDSSAMMTIRNFLHHEDHGQMLHRMDNWDAIKRLTRLMEMHQVALVQEKSWGKEGQGSLDCQSCGRRGRSAVQPSATTVSNKIEALRAHADVSSVAIENLRNLSAISQSPEKIKEAYLKAYEEWWRIRPPKFRTWGMFSNAYGWWTARDVPMCMDYSDAAADYMNNQVKFPNAKAFAVGNHQTPGEKFGVFRNNKPSGSHYNVHVYMADPQGRPIEVIWVDPWWRIH